MQAGRTADAVSAAEEFCRRSPQPEIYSEYLTMLMHDSRQTSATLRQRHEGFDHQFVVSKARDGIAFPNDPDPERRLRLGYICGEGPGAPSWYFLKPILECRDRKAVHVTWYHSGREHSERTALYRRDSDEWRDVSQDSDDDLVDMIRQDGIDILIDVSGHYDGNRLTLFGQRPAPIQVSFPNYPCTTGCSSIDYILTDRYVCPEGSEAQYSESVLRVPSGYLTYSAPASPEVRTESGECLRFGLFQRPAKFTTEFLDAAAEVLRGCPGAGLLIHYASRELDASDSLACEEWRSQFRLRGVACNRIEFAGRMREYEHLALIGSVDIALDTFHYNGQTTTCECLLMGVPVVSLAGEHHAARVGLSILSRVGLEKFAVGSASEFVEQAVALARDPAKRRELRRSLRGRLLQSTLADGSSVREAEQLLRTVWQRWCAANK